MRKNNSRELLFFEEKALKLKAVIAIDSIVLGPANASVKVFDYKTEDEAVADALDIAYFNSLRAALLKRNMGGASIVVAGNPHEIKNEMLFRALGVFLNRRKGELFMSLNKGVSYQDLKFVQKESDYILGLQKPDGGLGNIYENRAKGMMQGLKAIAKYTLKTGTLNGVKVVVQGIGDLGSALVKQLIAEGAKITVTDKIYDKIKEIQDNVKNINIEKPEDIYSAECAIFCSCADEKIIDKDAISKLQCKVLTGSTNQAIKNKKDAKILKEKGILYVPGYIINGGDIIQMSNEIEAFQAEKVENELEDIYYNTLELLEEAETNNELLDDLAIKKAAEYVKNVSAIKLLR